MKTYKIFLSSPGDCDDERNIVQEVVSKLNSDPLVSSKLHIDVEAWDWNGGVPLELLYSPQASVNKHLTLPEDCDLVIGCFKAKFGTPLPTNEFRKRDGTPFLSGSEYELHRAWDSRRRGSSKPEILVYRRMFDKAPTGEQYDQLQSFFQHPPFKEAEKWVGSLNRLNESDDFAQVLEVHLRRLISKLTSTELPFELWVKRQASLLTANAGPRYTRDAHVESDIGKKFDWLLARKSIIEEFDKALLEVFERIDDAPVFEIGRHELEEVAEWLRDNIWWQTSPDFSFISAALKKIETIAWAEHEKNVPSTEGGNSSRQSSYRQHSMQQLAMKSSHAVNLINRYSSLTSKRVLLLTGPAGQGKTHTLIHEINKTVEREEIAVGVMGQTLNSTGELWSVICNRLEWNGSSIALLDKLENEAANNNQRALIVIDALNEGSCRQRWRSELLGIIQDVLDRPHLVLVISVRSDYLNYVLPPLDANVEKPWIQLNHEGFSGIEPEALAKYFKHYGVNAPIAPPVGEFDNPLYVRLLAKSLQTRSFNHWVPSWIEVWEAWICSLEDDAKSKIGLDDPSRKSPIRRTLSKIAQAILSSKNHYLLRSEADRIGREISGNDFTVGFLCSAGALIDRLNDDDEVIEFGFERLSDTFFADCLLQKVFSGLKNKSEKHAALSKAFEKGGDLEALAFNDLDDHPLSTRRTGLLQAICISAPAEIGAEIPQLISKNEHDWQLAYAFTESLRWRSQPHEFGLPDDELYQLWQHRKESLSTEAELDDLISFALIPNHPFAFKHIIHPWLVDQESTGSRDACWSIHIASLWLEDHSALKTMVNWASSANLTGIHSEVALPCANLLAWCCSTSHQELRAKSIKGLTRILAKCPDISEQILENFLHINDPYIVEGVVVSILGMVIANPDSCSAKDAASRVYEVIFSHSASHLSHITVRHYARKIIELACKNGWLEEGALENSTPPYSSHLKLDEVPENKEALEALDDSRGFHAIYWSCVEHGDFYRYVMGGNSVSLVFSAQPLEESSEPVRPFNPTYRTLGAHKADYTFDLSLASRFIVWNALQLGWTSDRFEAFDSSHDVTRHGRITHGYRTERIGKKYQWIGWMTILGYLADNYMMRPDFGDVQRHYDNPSQVSDVHLYDPSRWLSEEVHLIVDRVEEAGTWNIPSLPEWPSPEPSDMQAWAESLSFDIPLTDIILSSAPTPSTWGDGPWIRVAVEHIWSSHFAPGQWGLKRKFMGDIWCQLSPMLIREGDLNSIVSEIDKSKVQSQLKGMGRNDLPGNWDISLTDWPSSKELFEGGFQDTSDSEWSDGFPVPWKWLAGKCGHPDKRDEHQPFVLPMPEMFDEWNLIADLAKMAVCKDGLPVFGMYGEQVLFAHKSRLQKLLLDSKYRLVWLVRGERRAFLSWGLSHDRHYSWVDYYAVFYLGMDGNIQTAWFDRELRQGEIDE